MNQPALQTVYQAVIMAKLLYVAPAWWGFSISTTSDRNRIAGFVRRSGFCEAGLAEISTLVDDAEDKLFHKILNDTNHVLFQLLSDQCGELTYSLRKRPHDRLLTQRTSRVSDCNFITVNFFETVSSYFSCNFY